MQIEQRTYLHLKMRLQRELAAENKDIRAMKEMLRMHSTRVESMAHREELRENLEVECTIRARKERQDLQQEIACTERKNGEINARFESQCEKETRLRGEIGAISARKNELDRVAEKQIEEQDATKRMIREHQTALVRSRELLARYRAALADLDATELVGGGIREKLEENESMERRVWEIMRETEDRKAALREMTGERDVTSSQ